MRSLILISAILLSFTAQAEEPRAFGTVKDVVGSVMIGKRNLEVGDTVYVGDQVDTGSRSRARILLDGGQGAFQMGADTSIVLEQTAKAKELRLQAGSVLSALRPAKKPGAVGYRVHGKAASMGVRGTTFFARQDQDGQTTQCICEGRVETRWDAGKQVLKSKHHDHYQVIYAGKAKPVRVKPPGDHTDEEITELKRLWN